MNRDSSTPDLARVKALSLLEDAVGSLREGFALWDPDLKFLFCNEKYKQLALPPGCSPPYQGQDAIEFGIDTFSKGYWQLPDDMNADTFAEHIGDLLRSHVQDLELVGSDGRIVLASSNPTKLGGYLLTFIDVTETRSAQQSRLDSVTDALQSLSDGIALFNSDFEFVVGNRRYLEIWYPGDISDPSPGEHMADIAERVAQSGHLKVPPGMDIHDLLKTLVESAKSFAKDIPIETQTSSYLASSHRTNLGGYLLEFTDVTETMRAEQKRIEAITDAIQATDDALALFDKDGKFVLANKAWTEGLFWHRDPPQPGDDGEAMFRSFLDSGFYLVPEGWDKEAYGDYILGSGYEYGKNIELYTSDGRTVISSSHLTGLGGYLCCFRDVTELRKTERELARQREIAHQNEKMSALGELLAGVAHELNNPLSVVFGYAQMLEGKITDPEIAERLDLIRQSAERSAKIVKTFLAMARQRPAKIELCSLNVAVKTAVDVSSYALKANGTQVVLQLDETVPAVSGDFDQLAQVFTNLVVNAGHALEEKRENGKLVLRSFYEAETDQVVVEVRDNGPGIPADIQSRIFEPFFTTKDVGEGTGVGLAFAHRTVDSHGGSIELFSNQGHGTSFFVKFSAATKFAEEPCREEKLNQCTDHLSVLVLDDEVGVARLTFDLLVAEGFKAKRTHHPHDAIQMLENETFDIILSDFKMPGMDGAEFFDAVKVVAPECVDRIGFITGDAMSERVRNFFAHTGCPYIEKPILKADLLKLINQLSGV